MHFEVSTNQVVIDTRWTRLAAPQAMTKHVITGQATSSSRANCAHSAAITFEQFALECLAEQVHLQVADGGQQGHEHQRGQIAADDGQ